MRNFIYLDTEYLSSFMAQENNGLETLRNLESNISSRKSETAPTTSQSETMSAELNAAVARGNLEHTKNISSTISLAENTEIYKETVSRLLHDNIFDYFEKYLDQNNLLITDNSFNVGDYIKKTGDFKFFETDFISRICNKNFFDSIFTISDIINGAKPAYSEINKNAKQYDELGKKLSTILNTMLPTPAFMIMDNLLILINAKHLREEGKVIQFKYSGEVNFIGQVNKLYKTTSAEDQQFNDFSAIINSLNDAGIMLLSSFGINTANIYIVTPIAIYF